MSEVSYFAEYDLSRKADETVVTLGWRHGSQVVVTAVIRGQDAAHLALLLDAKARELDRLETVVSHQRRIMADNHAAFEAMRDAINEALPIQSSEADLRKGPEHSVSCAVVAEAVVSRVSDMQSVIDTLYSMLYEAQDETADADWSDKARETLRGCATWAVEARALS